MGLAWDLESVIFRVGGESLVAAGFRQRSRGLLIKDIAEALEEQQREDELLVVAGINGSTQKRGRPPEVGLKPLLTDPGGHVAFFLGTLLFAFFLAFCCPNLSILTFNRSLAKLRTSIASSSLIMPSVTWYALK